MEVRRIEFYNTPTKEIFYQDGDGQHELTENSYDIIEQLLEIVNDNYIDAYKSLEQIYKKSKPNVRFYRFKMVSRFIRCNCGEMDTFKFDIDENGCLHLEQVKCPLRGTGDCKYENVLCMPKKYNKIKGRQLEIAEALANGLKNQEIADKYFISINTVRNIIQQIKYKIGVKNTGQIVTWYNSNCND